MSQIPIGMINRAIATGFEAVTPGVGTPDDRIDALYKASFGEMSTMTVEGSLMEAALSDAEYLAGSAIHYAETTIPEVTASVDAVDVARDSLGLLRVASLDMQNWAKVRKAWRYEDRKNHIPLENLTHTTDENGLVVVDYSPRATKLIETFPSARGCPAKGIVLNRFYQRFVEVIYGE